MVPEREMSSFRPLAASLLSATLSFALVTSSGCSTEAVGIDDCRDIEYARCEAGKPCGIVPDVEACKRFYRDHCLHGLAGEQPPSAAVNDCVTVIEAAGQCASKDPERVLGDCSPEVTEPQLQLLTACDVVSHPERATECAFLIPEGEEPSGSGGAPSEPDEPDASAGAAGQATAGAAATE